MTDPRITPDDSRAAIPHLAAPMSDLDALMTEVSLAVGGPAITVSGPDEGDGVLTSVRPLAGQPGASREGADWETHADAVIFGWLVSP
jgi:hypothetical protein